MAILFSDFFGSDPSKMDQTRKLGEHTSRILEFKPESGSEFLCNFLCHIRHFDLGHSGEWSLHGLAAPEFVSGNNGD